MEAHHNQATFDRFMKRKEIGQSQSRPATAGPSANSSASVDELQRVVGGLDISATLPVSHVDVYCGVNFDATSFDLVHKQMMCGCCSSNLILLSPKDEGPIKIGNARGVGSG